jgi:LuxR family maltose regulon positive regulatory protein
VLSEAKLAPPRARAGVIARTRLFADLDRLEGVELTLVTAPAGFGKTVAVSSWLRERPALAVAWISVEETDEDAIRLWTAISTAVDRLRPGIARRALATLRTPRVEVETAIDALLNGLASYDGPIVIVLDDLHRLHSGDGLRSVGYAVERLPRATRIVATTRLDPGLPLGRLRARGELGELRASDLALTVDEATSLLSELGAKDLDREDVELLVARTEGWPAGMGLAAIWLAGARAPREQLRQFSGSNRHVADYLTAEVLDILDADVRAFLVRSSVLGRFSAQLCDAVLERRDSADRLHAIERSNLFLIALDARGEWYRYHHLFRELLITELTTGDRAAIPAMHKRAAAWFAQQGMLGEALEASWEAGDPASSADLLQEHHLALIRSGRSELFMDGIGHLPDAELARRPVLAVAAALVSGMLAQPATERKRYAAIAEAGTEALPDELRSYVQAVAALTSGALLDRDLGFHLAEMERAVELTRSIPALTVTTLAVCGFVHYLAGDIALAQSFAAEALARPEAPQSHHGSVYGHAVLALVECDRGRATAAEAQARHAVSLTRELGLASAWSGGVAHHALGEALLAQGNARAAERELERARTLRQAGEPRLDTIHTLLVLARSRIVRGRVALASSELSAAFEQLTAFDDAGRLSALATDVERTLSDALVGEPIEIETPSPAELSILRLLATDKSQREVADQLFLSLNTIKSHSRNLYAKLGAHSRDEAVQKAFALGLVDAPDTPST